MENDKITITELRSKIYKVSSEVQLTGEEITVTEHGEPVWKIVPIKKKAKTGAKKTKEKELNWYEKIKKKGPRKPSIILCDEETLIYGKLDEWNELKNL